MLVFISRRLLQSVFVMLAVSLIAFTLFRFIGDPVAQMVGQETSIADQERLRESLGLNDPIITQYGHLYRSSPRRFFIQCNSCQHAHRHFHTDVCHWHLSDIPVWCTTGLAADVWTR